MDKQNRIFVGGIPVRIEKKNIVDFFSQFGKILHCKIKKNSKTGRSLGYAYLTFESSQSAESLVNKQVEFYGRICECKQVFKKEELKDELAREKKKKLLVYMLDPTVTNLELKNLFESLTSISHAYVVKDPDSDLNLGYGYVVFHDEAAVDNFRKLKLTVMLKGQEILFTNEAHLPPKKGRMGSGSFSHNDGSNSKPSHYVDSDMSESHDQSLQSHQNTSKHGSHLKSRKSNQLSLPWKHQTSKSGPFSIISDLAEAGDSCYVGNSISGTHSNYLNDSRPHLLGHNLRREIGSNRVTHNPVNDKDNTGYTQTTKISSNQGGWTQLHHKLKLNVKKGKLADVLRACPYLNHSPQNYKFNYILKGRLQERPPLHILNDLHRL